MTGHWTEALMRFDQRACPEGVAWARHYPTLGAAWEACERGDWMGWLLDHLRGPEGSTGHRRVVLAGCACARLALPLYEAYYPGDERIRRCLDLRERWARGDLAVRPEAAETAARAAEAAAGAVARPAGARETAVWAAARAAEAAAWALAPTAWAAAWAAVGAAAGAAGVAAGAAMSCQCADAIRAAVSCPTEAELAGGPR